MDTDISYRQFTAGEDEEGTIHLVRGATGQVRGAD